MSNKCGIKKMDLPSEKCVICDKTIEEIGGTRMIGKNEGMIFSDKVKLKIEEEKLNNKSSWFCQKCGSRTCYVCGEPMFRPPACDVIYDNGCSAHIAITPADLGCINSKCERYKPLVHDKYNDFFDYYDYTESDFMDILSKSIILLPKMNLFHLNVVMYYYSLSGEESVRIKEVAQHFGKTESFVNQIMHSICHNLLNLLRDYKMSKIESSNCSYEYKECFERQLERNKGMKIKEVFCVKNHPYILVRSKSRVYRCSIAERCVDLTLEEEVKINLSLYDCNDPNDYISFGKGGIDLKEFKLSLDICKDDYKQAFQLMGKSILKKI